MTIKLSDHFTNSKLFKFVIPSVIMMIFSAIYGVVDGLFVSNFVGDTGLAAVNFTWPLVMLLATPGFMFGTGGGALVGKLLGEKKNDKANSLFSLSIYTTIIIGVIFAILSFIFMDRILILMGAENDLLEYSIVYGRINVIATPFFMIQMAAQTFFITAEKPKVGLISTVFAGVANIFFDFLFIVVFDMGIKGAAIGTALSTLTGGVIPLVYFMKKNTSLLRLGKTKIDFKALSKATTNGSSELMSNISMNIVAILYNNQLLKYVGDYGVSAYGVIMYVNFFFVSIFIGYSVGVAPIVSYNYGAQNDDELKNIFKKSIYFIIPTSILMFVLCYFLAYPISYIFVSYNKELLDLTTSGFKIFCFSFIFVGLAIFGPSFFTALNNGLISALIAFLRTLVFQILAVIFLPKLLGVDGIWLSVVFAEFMSFILSMMFLIIKKKKYNYA